MKPKKKGADKYENWGNSYSAIANSVSIYGLSSKRDEKYRRLIIRTLQLLPGDVRKRVLREVAFVVFGDSTQGRYFSIASKHTVPLGEVVENQVSGNFVCNHTQPSIMLNFALIKNRSAEYKMYVIAHEIAHFILMHWFGGRSAEEKTDDLCGKWGFTAHKKSRRAKGSRHKRRRSKQKRVRRKKRVKHRAGKKTRARKVPERKLRAPERTRKRTLKKSGRRRKAGKQKKQASKKHGGRRKKR